MCYFLFLYKLYCNFLFMYNPITVGIGMVARRDTSISFCARKVLFHPMILLTIMRTLLKIPTRLFTSSLLCVNEHVNNVYIYRSEKHAKSIISCSGSVTVTIEGTYAELILYGFSILKNIRSHLKKASWKHFLETS